MAAPADPGSPWAGGGSNLHAYAGGNPVSFSDPFGLCSKEDDYQDCDEMISAEQGVQLLANAVSAGDWEYTQGGSRKGQEPAVNLGAKRGGCTDFTYANTRTLMGASWRVQYPRDKANTTSLYGGSTGTLARGHAMVDVANAQPGDIVVSKPGGHAVHFVGVTEGGRVLGWANDGLPANPDRQRRDYGLNLGRRPAEWRRRRVRRGRLGRATSAGRPGLAGAVGAAAPALPAFAGDPSAAVPDERERQPAPGTPDDRRSPGSGPGTGRRRRSRWRSSALAASPWRGSPRVRTRHGGEALSGFRAGCQAVVGPVAWRVAGRAFLRTLESASRCAARCAA